MRQVFRSTYFSNFPMSKIRTFKNYTNKVEIAYERTQSLQPNKTQKVPKTPIRIPGLPPFCEPKWDPSRLPSRRRTESLSTTCKVFLWMIFENPRRTSFAQKDKHNGLHEGPILDQIKCSNVFIIHQAQIEMYKIIMIIIMYIDWLSLLLGDTTQYCHRKTHIGPTLGDI